MTEPITSEIAPTLDIPEDINNQDIDDEMDIAKELEAKFDELFGPVDKGE